MTAQHSTASTRDLISFLLECQRVAIRQHSTEVTAQISALIADLISREVLKV